MFKLGEYDEDDMHILVDYLKDAGFKVDIRPSLVAWKDSTAYLEGRFGEIRGVAKNPEKYERYLEALRSVLSSDATQEDFRDRFLTEIDPLWKVVDDFRSGNSGLDEDLSEEDAQKMEKALSSAAEWIMAYDFVDGILSINNIEIGQHVGEKLDDPVVRIRVGRDDCSPDERFLKREIEIIVEKVYDIYLDEFSMPLFQEIDDDFRYDYSDEYLRIMSMGMMIEDMVADPSSGKIDLKSFEDRCRLDLGGSEKVNLSIDAGDVAEDIARVLEKNGVVKIKGNIMKWKIK